ncbi:MAG: hypothetical protein ACOC6F_02135 [bacterium]
MPIQDRDWYKEEWRKKERNLNRLRDDKSKTTSAGCDGVVIIAIAAVVIGIIVLLSC